VNDPKRWRDAAGGASERARSLVRAGRVPRPMTAAERARGAAAIERIAARPVPRWTAWKAWLLGATTLGIVGAIIAVAMHARGAEHPRATAHAARHDAPMSIPPSPPAANANVDAIASTPVAPPTATLPPVAAMAPSPVPATPTAATAASAPRPAHNARTRAIAGAAHAPTIDTSAAAEPEDLLARENAMVSRIRAAVAGDPRQALTLAAEYDTQFPHGQHAETRAWLEIEALQRLGHDDDARARAIETLHRFPGGMYTAQLRHVLDAPH
jgi:hypothetical protein